MKGSKNISARTTTENGAPSGSRSGNRSSPVVNGFALTGVSKLPDPATHAYRKDLADVALASCVIASHYAEPLLRHVAAEAPLQAEPNADAELVGRLHKGDAIRMLDLSAGWAWAYGPDGKVGYVRAEAVAP